MNLAATTVNGKRKYASSRANIAASLSRRVATRRRTCRRTNFLYGQEFAVEDIATVMHAANIHKAHLVGLSMGGFATLLFGLRFPGMASALVVASAGTGAPKREHEAFKATCQERGNQLITQGWRGGLAEDTGHSPTRIQLKNKDPRGWTEFMTHLEDHSAIGSGLTMKRYQGDRGSIFDWEPQLRNMTVPTLLAVGDEDEPCIGDQHLPEESAAQRRSMDASAHWPCHQP